MPNRAAFFDAVRRPIFGGRIRQAQVDGCNIIIDGWREHGTGDHRHLAYVLATAYHETAYTMQPIHERGRRGYFDKYEPGTRIGKRLGNTIPGDGFRFRGRGFVQLTGRAGYQKLSNWLNVDLVGDPERALEPDIAVRILIVGMTNGLFTGKKLSDYINGESCDYWNARRIVNGTDRASMIAGYAREFEMALEAAYARAPEPARVPEGAPSAPVGPPRWLKALIAALVAAGAAVAGYLGLR